MPDSRRADWWLQWALSVPRFPLPLGKEWSEPFVFTKWLSPRSQPVSVAELTIHMILTEETGLWKTVLVLTHTTSQN